MGLENGRKDKNKFTDLFKLIKISLKVLKDR